MHLYFLLYISAFCEVFAKNTNMHTYTHMHKILVFPFGKKGRKGKKEGGRKEEWEGGMEDLEIEGNWSIDPPSAT